MAKRPTIHDVAAAAGVSRGTVSRVLNDDRYVSPAAHAAVRRAIAETGYIVNRNARSLVTQRTGSVVMVLSEPHEKVFEDPNYSTTIRTAIRRLGDRDVSLVIMLAGDDGDRDQVVHYVRGGHADGVLLMSTHAGDPLVDELESLRIPAVACGAVIGKENVIPYAAADDREGARQMARYLVEQGRRKIATITGPMDTPGGIQRLEGFADVLGRKASKKLIEHGDWTQLSGESAMARLLERTPTSTRSSWPPTSWRPARCPRCGPPDAGCPTTWPWAASTTRRSPPPPTRPSPRSASRSPRSRRRPYDCCSRSSTGAARWSR